VVGTVRDARDLAPVAGATVAGEWLELTFQAGKMARRVPRLAAMTGENGWFAICNVPSSGTMMLTASRGPDSTDVIEIQVPAEGFLRRELYLGPARTVVVVDSARRTDSLAPPPRRVHRGDGRLSGTVATVVGGQPLAGAQVGIADGPQTLTNERGEWSLHDSPAGTRMLEVRAVGYYPERRRVDVVAGAEPVRVALSTLKAVLDTVKVSANRLRYVKDQGGFAQRRRTGGGRYLDATDIERRAPLLASDLFRQIPGMRMEREGLDTRIIMRGLFTEQCAPSVFIDGHLINSVLTRGIDGAADTAATVDVDDWVRPKEIAGLEVYAAGAVPKEFQTAFDGCGAVLIWSK
jgi:hypothetical protein